MLACALALVGGRAARCSTARASASGCARSSTIRSPRISSASMSARRSLLAFALASAVGGIAGYPGARGRPAGHADVRHVGDVQGPDRDDDRRARLDPRRDPRRPAARRRSRRTANGISARRSAICSPISLLFACLVLRPGGLLGEAPPRDPALAAGSVIDGRLSGRRPLQYRRHLVHRAVGLSAAAHRRDLVRPAGLLRDRRLCGRHRDRAVGLAARARRSAGAPPSAAAAAVLVGLPTLRLHGLYFAIATLAFAEMVRLLFEHVPLSGGDRRRAGRPERRRRFPRHPLHLRERCQPAAVPAADLRAARARCSRASCCWSDRASASPFA